jgi:hypothetical protein
MLTHSLLNQTNPILSNPLFNGSVSSNNNNNNNNNSSIHNSQNSMNNASNTNNTVNVNASAQISNENLASVSDLPGTSSNTLNNYSSEELMKHIQEKVNF